MQYVLDEVLSILAFASTKVHMLTSDGEGDAQYVLDEVLSLLALLAQSTHTDVQYVLEEVLLSLLALLGQKDKY